MHCMEVENEPCGVMAAAGDYHQCSFIRPVLYKERGEREPTKSSALSVKFFRSTRTQMLRHIVEENGTNILPLS